MRPVDKGSDRGEFNPYTDAQASLIELLGSNCSYCERLIAAAIHVEHKIPKSQDENLKHSWINFLLACSNCNSGKSAINIELTDYIWPDNDNTLRAFRYDREGRVFANLSYSDDINAKIKATWELVGLNKHIDTSIEGFVKPTDKDARWRQRRDEWRQAERNKLILAGSSTPEIVELIVDRALANGFFSIWYNVFFDNPIVRRKLVEAFKGTAASCFDDDYLPVHRPGGLI